MGEFVHNHRKLCTVLATVILVVLCFLYIRAIFIPGIRHYDAFLYLQDDGSFRGSDMYAEYSMNIEREKSGAEISFSVNGAEKKYQVERLSSSEYVEDVLIYEDDKLIFDGIARDMSGLTVLEDREGKLKDFIRVTASGVTPKIEELYPDCTKLYKLAVSSDMDRRGNPWMIIYILIIALVLVVDIVWEDFFYLLRHGLHVDGGSPSDYYRFMQKAGRVISIIAILVFVVMTFTTH